MEEKLSKILYYIENYRKYCYEKEVLNYYQIFDLSRNDDVYVLKKRIKEDKLKILFHPDLGKYIPDDYQKDFVVLSDSIRDMENVFSDISNKMRYDANLDKQIEKEKSSFVNRGEQNSNCSYGKGNPNFNDGDANLFSNVFVSKMEKLKFDNIIKQNIKQYGYSFTFQSIYDFMFNNYSNGFTRSNNVRAEVEQMGQDKIYSILREYSDRKDFSKSDLSSIVYYFSSLLDDKVLCVQMESFLSATTETISKYNINHGCNALNKFISYQNIDYFTNNNMAREKLDRNVKKEDGQMLIMIYLSRYRYFDEKCNFMNLINLSNKDLVEKFVVFLSEQMGIGKKSGYRESKR